ncbi:unnamed protein product [Malus baccata var. baccata]
MGGYHAQIFGRFGTSSSYDGIIQGDVLFVGFCCIFNFPWSDSKAKDVYIKGLLRGLTTFGSIVQVYSDSTSMAQKEAKASEEAKPPSPAETSMIIASTAAPARLLVIFCLINLLNYVDRGTIASNGVNGSRKSCTESGVCTPATQKTAWLSIFYMCISSGYALGYVYGGVVGSHTKWRYAFVGESILMLPFAILGFVMKPLQMKGFSHPESKKAPIAMETAVEEVQGSDILMKEDVGDSTIQKSSNSKVNPISRFMKDMKALLGDKVYVVNVLGYIAYNFVIGAYSYWGPKAGYNIYHMSNADMIFGGVTIACGILGTLGGGFLLDYMTGTISNAFKLLSMVTLIGGAFCLGAFWMKNLYAFLALFAIGQLLVFATQGPVNYVCLHCVKPSMRPLSMAISTVAIHLFGDVPSAPLVGVLQDAINNWRATALILTSIFFPAALIWFIGIFLHSITTKTETSNTTPLDEGKKIETIESVAEP